MIPVTSTICKFIKQNAQKYRQICVSASAHNENNLTIEHFPLIMVIGINRPTKRNCLDSVTLLQLREALRQAEADPGARAVVLHGEGGNFCSGWDVDELHEHGYEPLVKAAKGLSEGPLCKKPVIAAMQGYAVAEGFELALACDLRVIEDTAVMGAISRRFGAPMLMGGSARLIQTLGLSRGLDLLLSTRLITGQDAQQYGLAARSVSTGTALGQAISLATTIGKFNQDSLLHDRQNAWRAASTERGSHNYHSQEEMENMRIGALEELKKNVIKFKEGKGRHAKSFGILKKERMSWELEDDMEREKAKIK